MAFPNGDYIEMGTMVGRNPVQKIDVTNESVYYATTLSGAPYNEVTGSTVSVGSTQTYEISDVNKDRTYLFKRNGGQIGSVTVISTNAVEIEVGTETTVDSGLPKTHMYNISWLKSNGVWEYWGLADWIGEDPSNSPLWILNCSPNYQHIHVGSGATGNCS